MEHSGTFKPRVIHLPWMMKPGDVGVVYGGYMGDKSNSEVAIQPLTGFTGELAPDSAKYRIKPFNVNDNLAQFEIPAGIPYDVWAVWVKNANGWSKPEYVNKAQIFWVSEHDVYAGQKLTVAGRNIVNPLSRSADGVKVEFVPCNGGAVLNGKIYDITDYTVHFTAPEGLAAGEKYEIRYTNGVGGEYGIAEMTDVARETVTAVAVNDNIKFFDEKYDLNIAWLSGVDTKNTVNVKDHGAKGDGAANDTAAFSAALSALGNAGGGILYVPEGVYIFDQITLNENTAMKGVSPEKSVLKWSGVNVGTGSDGSRLIKTDANTVGIFDIKILSEHTRPKENISENKAYAMSGYVQPIYLGRGIDTKGGGYALVNVHVKVADGRGPMLWGRNRAVVHNCSIDSTHAALFFVFTERVRVTSNTIKNGMSGGVCFWDSLTLKMEPPEYDRCYMMGQAYIANNRLIGDALHRRAQDGQKDKSDWWEILYDGSEHRPADLSGDENVLINNVIEGTYGDHATNAGEGICNQAGYKHNFYARPVSATETTLKTGKDLSKVIRNYNYIIIVGGHGTAQVRKIVDYKDDVLIIDKPWDVIPTTDSVYAVDAYLCARNLWVNNTYTAKTNKAAFFFDCKNYDTVVAGNTITESAGIWYISILQDVPGWVYCKFAYFLTIYNNILTGWGNPYFSPSQSVVIGSCYDAGIRTEMSGDRNCTTSYGNRILHNTVIGRSANPQVLEVPEHLKPWYRNSDHGERVLNNHKRFTLKSGIFVATQQEVSYPNVMGEIVDGNFVTNTVNGVQLSNTSFDAVLRNNNFTGNASNFVGVDESVRTSELTSSRGLPGIETLPPICKAALK